MKLITWNCQGAFRKKFARIAKARPDLAVIQECEHPDRLKWDDLGTPPLTQLWFGEKPTRGVGVFSWTGLELSLAENYDPAIRHCIPVKVSGTVRFNLLAIWAMQASDRRLSYIAQVNLGLINYQAFIQETDTVLIGDLNSNQRLQHADRLGSHDWVVRSLSDLDMVSAYHYYFRQKHGLESAYTYFFARKPDRPYHLDYIFIPRRWLKRLKKVMVGKPETWLKNSDHCPLTVEIID